MRKAVQEKESSINLKTVTLGGRTKGGGGNRMGAGPSQQGLRTQNRADCLIKLNFTQTVTMNNTTTPSYPLVYATLFCLQQKKKKKKEEL